MSDTQSSWWLLPVVSGAEPCQSAESGQSGESVDVVDLRDIFPMPATMRMGTFAYMGTGLITLKTPEPKLSAEDEILLDEIRKQRANIFTQIQSVVAGTTSAFFIWGPGGHSKSFIVRASLQYCPNVKWITTDVSAKGLFNLLKDFPTHIHVFEDMEKMYKQADCQAVLRAACGGQSQRERTVCWEKDGDCREDPFEFAGGIIIISNEDPKGGSLKMGAIASRFAPQKWEHTDPELAAIIRDVALNTPCKYGYSKEQRLEVAEFVISEMANRPTGLYVDLRTFCEHALPAFHQSQIGQSLVPWQDVVRAKIKGGPRRDYKTVEKERLMHAACEAYFSGSDKAERLAAWKALTGLGSSAQFYEYLKEAKEAGIFEQFRAKQTATAAD